MEECSRKWLAIARTLANKPEQYRKLLLLAEERAVPACDLNSRDLQNLGLKLAEQEHILNPGEPDAATLEWLEDENHHLLTLSDTDYPGLLKRIATPPPVLFVSGDPIRLWHPGIAIVGSRTASTEGAANARSFGKALGKEGFSVISGLAMGIDTYAHKAALEAGSSTIAVLGCGPDQAYPRQNWQLADEISKSGCIVSEYFPGTKAYPGNFPRRNRIISGLSLGVLVIEAGIRSGTLSTARHANEQGREVFAIPGSIHNPVAKGCHLLIKQGSKLVETVDDVLQDIKPLMGELHHILKERLAEKNAGQEMETRQQPSCLDDPEYLNLLETMPNEPFTIDQLIDISGLTAQKLSSMLLIMELQGIILARSGGYYYRSNEEIT